MKFYTVGYKHLSDATSVRRAANYMTDPNRRSHRFCDIEGIVWTGPDSTAAAIASRLGWAANEIKKNQTDGRPIKSIATMHMIRFLPGSRLTAAERAHVAEKVTAVLDVKRGALQTWHVNRYDGGCDFHVLVSDLDTDPVPRKRRSPGMPVYSLLRKAVHTATCGILASRAALPRNPAVARQRSVDGPNVNETSALRKEPRHEPA